MLHLYCISSTTTEKPLKQCGPGVDGGQLELFSSGGLSILYSHHESVPDRLHPENLVVHAAVVERLHRQITTLPLRFGLQALDLNDLERLIAENGERWSVLLDSVDDQVELGVRFLSEKEPPTQGEAVGYPDGERSGAAFLRERASHYSNRERQSDKRDRLIDGLLEEIGSSCRDYRLARGELAGKESRLLSLLVPRGESARLQQKLTDLLEGAVGVHISGPWPPWNFVSSHEEGVV